MRTSGAGALADHALYVIVGRGSVPSKNGRGVRHGAVRRTRFRNPVDFRWISGFQFGFLDFWISKWISGFQSGFLDFKVDFWISKWISGFQVDFWISKWISGFQADFWISKRISGFRYF